jgi:hypothetical protein
VCGLSIQAVPVLTNVLRSRRQFVKRVAISHKRSVIIGGCVPERPEND